MMVAELRMMEIAQRLNEHLKRFEADPVINARRDPELGGGSNSGLLPYWHAGAYYTRGAKLHVTYVLYQGSTALGKQDALAYLEWLDAGNVGRHHEALRQRGKRP